MTEGQSEGGEEEKGEREGEADPGRDSLLLSDVNSHGVGAGSQHSPPLEVTFTDPLSAHLAWEPRYGRQPREVTQQACEGGKPKLCLLFIHTQGTRERVLGEGS